TGINLDKESDQQTTDQRQNVCNDRILNKKFLTWELAEKWYIDYARNVGFDVRRCCCKTSKDGIVKNRQWECSNAGYRRIISEGHQRIKRGKPNNRCGCPAKFRVARDIRDGLYRVTNFDQSHNHPLESSETAHRLKCN
ncbi:Far-red impaired responsive (FAR1) family protein, partial [Striga hermonthica]